MAEPLSKLLRRVKDVRRLHLAFGTSIGDPSYPEFHYTVGSVRLLISLAKDLPWPNIGRLKLAIVIEEQTLLDFLFSTRQT
jgi:hypothetical protein